MAKKKTSKGAQLQARFVEEYLVDFNATQAALRAGYSKSNPSQQAHRLMQRDDVKAALKAAIDARSQRTGITADRVLQETELVSFSDIEHFTVDDAGRLQVVEGAPAGATRAVAKKKFKVTTKEIPMKGGEPMVITERETEIALWNKPEMLKVAGKHVDVHGFNERMELMGKNGRELFPNAERLDLPELRQELVDTLAKIDAILEMRNGG